MKVRTLEGTFTHTHPYNKANNKTMVINLRDDSPWYEQFRYPAGEWQVRLKPTAITALEEADELRIIANLYDAESFTVLALLKNAIDNIGVIHTDLILPYLPYSRADRQFTTGDCCGLETFGNQLNALRFDGVVTLDVHNARAAAQYITRLINIKATELIRRAIKDFADRYHTKHLTVVFPDKGARDRYFIDGIVACNTQSIEYDQVYCEKKRDAVTGKFIGFTVPKLPEGQPALIIDDLCDGGGTFTGIVEEMYRRHVDFWPSFGLYVSHGIFSKGFGELAGCFEQVYTTNSFPEKGPDKLVKVYDCLPVMLKALE